MGGVAQTDDFFRLFMAPGVNHCGGGIGPGVIDDLTALEQWVEQGVAPNQIVAAHYTLGVGNGIIDRRRPLCPYPQIAKYRGAGDINAWQSFTCETPNIPDATVRHCIGRNAAKRDGDDAIRSAAGESHRRVVQSGFWRSRDVYSSTQRRQRDVQRNEYDHSEHQRRWHCSRAIANRRQHDRKLRRDGIGAGRRHAGRIQSDQYAANRPHDLRL